MSHTKANVRVVQTEPQYARRLAKMQSAIFPTLTDDELLNEWHYLKHLELFPEGQLTALVHLQGKWVVVGSTSTFLIRWDDAMQPHTFAQATSNGWLTNHNPAGRWIYGADMSVHPEFHGMGIGSALYRARQNVVRKLNLKGEIAGGMIPGFHRYRDQMNIEAYVAKVVTRELFDPTLSVQVKNGFRVERVMHDHITDPRSDNCAALIVRPNPHYRDERERVESRA
jgi:GNAT superfamily N-acetyltransferase